MKHITKHGAQTIEGKITFNGGLATAAYVRHVQLAAVLGGAPADQPTQVVVGTAGGLQFPTNTPKYAYVQFEVPDDWDGTDMYFEADWFPDAAGTTGDDTVEWGFKYRAIAEGEAINNGTEVTILSADSGDYAQYITKHARVTLPATTGNQPLTKQDHVYMQVYRNTGGDDDFASTVVITAFELIYNSIGIPTT